VVHSSSPAGVFACGVGTALVVAMFGGAAHCGAVLEPYCWCGQRLFASRFGTEFPGIQA